MAKICRGRREQQRTDPFFVAMLATFRTTFQEEKSSTRFSLGKASFLSSGLKQRPWPRFAMIVESNQQKQGYHQAWAPAAAMAKVCHSHQELQHRLVPHVPEVESEIVDTWRIYMHPQKGIALPVATCGGEGLPLSSSAAASSMVPFCEMKARWWDRHSNQFFHDQDLPMEIATKSGSASAMVKIVIAVESRGRINAIGKKAATVHSSIHRASLQQRQWPKVAIVIERRAVLITVIRVLFVERWRQCHPKDLRVTSK
ncbi:expressed unknown protein [Seminavis robusta]|uniref:Uncharacterized protein n=1 Tax=Seminavis robusta TaxID=568900 RepID=A0A9N8HBW1_9STRA|nr:expressed unknown protein [Seminavis robusta]|eukprot:Sro198_g084010.1 n/a (257) ;mRNA; r:22129-23053